MSRESRKVISAVATTTAVAYTALDQVGDLLTFSNVADAAQGAATIESLALVDNEKKDADLVLFLFSRAPTLAGDNAAFSVSDADMAYCLGTIAIAAADYKDVAAVNSVATKANIQLVVQNEETKTGTKLRQDVFGALLLASGTPNWSAAANLNIKLGVRR